MEARLFTEEEIPWDEIAFPDGASETLERYFSRTGRTGTYALHCIDIT
jgi:hypothetical protein